MEYFTTKEIAEKLKTTEATVRRWIRAGNLEAHKVGQAYRVSDQQLRKFLEKK